MSVLKKLEQNRRVLEFIDSSHLNSQNNNTSTFLIGKNGSGKSRLLRSIIIHTLKNPDFHKILAISNTQYHKYPYIWELAKEDYLNIEKYTCTAFENHSSWIKYQNERFREDEGKDIDKYHNTRISQDSSILNPEIFDKFYKNEIRWSRKNQVNETFLNDFLHLDSIIFNIDQIKNLSFKIIETLEFLELDPYIEIHTKINTLIDTDLKKLIEILHFHSNENYLKDINILLSILENINKFQKIPILSIDNDELYQLSILIKLNLIRITNIKVQKKNKIIQIHELSSGEKSILSIIFSLLSNLEHNSLICIDEPEINLHPEWQEKIIELLEKVSSNYYGCHFFIATHSPQIISGIKNDNTFILDLNTNLLKNSSKFKNRSSDFQLSEVFNFPGNNNRLPS
jgi:ABC-type lipoprotein export system ATPase subunit